MFEWATKAWEGFTGMFKTAPMNLSRRNLLRGAPAAVLGIGKLGGEVVVDPRGAMDAAAQAVVAINNFSGMSAAIQKVNQVFLFSSDIYTKGGQIIPDFLSDAHTTFDKNRDSLEVESHRLIGHLNCLDPQAKIGDFFKKRRDGSSVELFSFCCDLGLEGDYWDRKIQNLTVEDFTAKVTPDAIIKRAWQSVNWQTQKGLEFIRNAEPHIERFRSVGQSVPYKIQEMINNLPAKDDPSFVEEEAKLKSQIEAELASPKKIESSIPKEQRIELFGIRLFENQEGQIFYATVEVSAEEKEAVNTAVNVLQKLGGQNDYTPVIQARHKQDYFEINKDDAKRLQSFLYSNATMINSGIDLGKLTSSLSILKAFGEKQNAIAFGRDMKSVMR